MLTASRLTAQQEIGLAFSSHQQRLKDQGESESVFFLSEGRMTRLEFVYQRNLTKQNSIFHFNGVFNAAGALRSNQLGELFYGAFYLGGDGEVGKNDLRFLVRGQLGGQFGMTRNNYYYKYNPKMNPSLLVVRCMMGMKYKISEHFVVGFYPCFEKDLTARYTVEDYKRNRDKVSFSKIYTRELYAQMTWTFLLN